MFLKGLTFSCFLFFLGISFFVDAQNKTTEPGNWFMLFNQTRIHNKLSIHVEAQFRSYNIQPNSEQILLRGGINFHHNPHIILTAGYGWITNYANDEKIFKPQIIEENRLWEQIILKNNSDRLFFEHRYRMEQRWIETNAISYKNRIRYLLRVTVPINNKELIKKTLFTSFYNEIFIHLSNTPFDRNRLYGAIGFQFSSPFSVQLGYMMQTVGGVTKEYLQLGINYNPDLRKAH
ncbi:MAG: DUF2490 domain-containing protein [Bacteroidota bacterium]